jgi:hypothetical protein
MVHASAIIPYETTRSERSIQRDVVAVEQDVRIRDYLRRRGVEDAEWVERTQNELVEWNKLA